MFVVGTGRSGTTVFFSVLACHPSFGWLSNYVERAPFWPSLALLSRIYDLPALGSKLPVQRTLMPKPAESVRAAAQRTRGLFNEHRPLSSADCSGPQITEYRRFLRAILRWQGKPRLLHKHTGFPRFAFISALAADARVIHIIRDGRAVAHSLMRVPWFTGDLETWWWGKMADEYAEEYEESGRDPLILAGIVWKTLMDHYEAQTREFDPQRIMAIRFSHWLAEPGAWQERVSEFLGLEFGDDFVSRARHYRLRPTDDGWRQGMPEVDQHRLTASLESHLQRYGFNP